MKKDTIIKFFLKLVLPLAFLSFWSCNEWDNHYDEGGYDLPSQSIIEYINSRSDLSTFASYLSTTGYDTVLDASQSYTVWAPTNEALSGLTFSDEELMLMIENHIARGKITTTKSVYAAMLSNKNMAMGIDAGNFKFGEGNILEADLNNANGLVHIIDVYAPYLNSLYEYLSVTEGLDSIKHYIYSNDEYTFNPAKSVELGVNDHNQAVYDSIFDYNNDVLNRIGDINEEDSIYTVVFPNNEAWDSAYSRITKYFVTPDVFGGEAQQRELTNIFLTRDIVYRGLIKDPASLDSITSTTRNVYHNPEEIFSGNEVSAASNGIMHVTSEMPFADTVAFFNEIRTEAEYTFYRYEASNNYIYNKSSYGTGLDVSNKRYILVEPDNPTSASSVTFLLPNVLAGKYNVYCVFVPFSITNPAIQKSTRADFAMYYYRVNSNRLSRTTLKPENNVTEKNGITKMFLGEINSLASNMILDEEDNTVVRLKVTCDVKDSEVGPDSEWSRDMLIDCIILEPVVE
ncbi:MAG: fasciclin domain-containing protein [Bacteroidales bacterium]|jgi:hypothetical protein|nr:fasciclin domain-containing protein [Bacteroidales bacterium]